MRTILFTLLFIHVLFCNAQKWCPPGAQWIYNYGWFYEYGFDKLTYEKDTVVLQQNCKKITRNRITKSCCPPSGPYYYKDEPVYTYAQNDTVFFFDGNKFKAAYFFSAKVGDTLHTSLKHCEDEPDIVEIVDSVGKIKINDDSLRFYRVKFINYLTPFLYPQKYLVFELIGCINTFIDPYITCIADDQAWYLDCYQNYNFMEYDVSPQTKCGFFTSDANVEESTISISPNPVCNTLFINTGFENQIDRMSIYNIAGKLMNFNIKATSNISRSIDINNFQNGTYLIQIVTQNGRAITKKFIKDAAN